MKHIYVMAVTLLLFLTPKPSFAFGYDLQDGPPFHPGEDVCLNTSSSEEAQLCLGNYTPDAQKRLEQTVQRILEILMYGSKEEKNTIDRFKLINKSWRKNMEDFCYDYMTYLYFPGSIYKSKWGRCELFMTNQRSRLLRALFLNESDHLNSLIRSGGLCAEDDAERDCLVRNVDYAREIFNFTTDGIVDDVEKSVDEKLGDLRKDTEKNIAILRRNIY